MKKEIRVILIFAAIIIVVAAGLLIKIAGTDSAGEVSTVTEENGASTEALSGIWQTASIGYEVDGEMQPEYYVQFTGLVINYGHMQNGEFVVDHFDKISLIENTDGGCKIQAQSENGVQYTYQTSEGDPEILEYYETWNEEEFSDKYSAGASLSKWK